MVNRRQYLNEVCGNVMVTTHGGFWDCFVGGVLSLGVPVTLLIMTRPVLHWPGAGEVYCVTAWAKPPPIGKVKRARGNAASARL